tara:strand:+ start:421 stop:681 length:261 start_codon:yes stop_codon:yes gene_type:complete
LESNVNWDLAWENLLEVRRNADQCLRVVKIAKQIEDSENPNDELMKDWMDMFPASQEQIEKIEQLYINYATRLRQSLHEVADNEIK